MEDKNIIEATEKQIKRLTKLYHNGLATNRTIPIGNLNLELWLILRSIAGIGASEIATTLGLVPPYFSKTPLKVWKEKVSQIIEIIDNAAMRIGRNSEETNILEYEYLTGRKVQRVKDVMFQHPEIDFLFTNLDGIILPAGGDGYGVLEAKSTLSYVYDTWLEKLPTYYFRQIMGELSVINEHPYFNGEKFEYAELSTLILDKRCVEVLRINRDGEFIEAQNIELSKWYDEHITAHIPPPESAAEWARAEVMDDTFIESSEKGHRFYCGLKELQKQKKLLENSEKELKDKIIEEIKDNETLLYLGEVIATYKQEQRVVVDGKRLKIEKADIYKEYEKISTFRVLRTKILKIFNY